jgi:DNA ligase-4
MEDALSYLGDGEPAPAPKLPSKSEEKCNNVRFRDLAMLFEKIEKAHGSEHKLKLLFSKEMKKQMNGESLYPLLRLVLPTIDSERGKYGLKQAMVAKTYVQALHLDKSSEAASRLINWKDPSKAQGVEVSKMVVGDFGVILEDVLKSRVRSEFSDATLRDVNELLDSLAQAISTADKTAIIRDRMLNQFSAVEQKWLARIIFSDLKIGLKHETVLNHFYPTALKRFNECVNLRLVCEEEGITTELSGVQLFVCYSPMLAKGFPQSSVGQITAVEAAMDQQPFIMDIKLDGERLAVHIGNDSSSVMMFTRRRNDYSEHYAPLGEIVRESVQIATGTYKLFAHAMYLLTGNASVEPERGELFVPGGYSCLKCSCTHCSHAQVPAPGASWTAKCVPGTGLVSATCPSATTPTCVTRSAKCG